MRKLYYKTHGNHHGAWYGVIFDPDEYGIKISWGYRYIFIGLKK